MTDVASAGIGGGCQGGRGHRGRAYSGNGEKPTPGLVPDQLPDPGPGKTYQMWFVPPQGAPVSAGLLSGTAPVLLEGGGQDAAAVALSVEPAGGSPQPTTTPVLVIPVT